MKTITLKFSSFVYLTAFLKYAKTANPIINLEALSLHCECSQKAINVACGDFRATVV